MSDASSGSGSRQAASDPSSDRGSRQTVGGAAYLVLYEGRPADPDAFLDYYAGEHVPLLWRFPGIRCVEIDLGRDDGGFFMVVRLLFESLDDLRTAITSPEREDARADMSENFPEFEGRVRHQVVELTTVSPDGEMRPPLRA